MKRVFITGITGQDGSYLAEYLLEKGYEVHGLVRRIALEEPEQRLARIARIKKDVVLHAGSLESYPSLFRILSGCKVEECYHLGAQSFVPESFEDAFSTMKTNCNGTHYLLSVLCQLQPDCKFYFAGSSEMFGKVREAPQCEAAHFHPRSPYGISKVAGYYLTINYREAYQMFCANGMLFNHESPRRGLQFVTRKITHHVARIKLGLSTELRLGNLEARRDWGHAADYVRAMHLMLQQPQPDDYVVATGETHSVREFCDLAFSEVGLDYREFVSEDPQFYRPAEAAFLVGDATKARQVLGWRPRYTFRQLIAEMVANDLALLQGDAQPAYCPPPLFKSSASLLNGPP
jgi:GDPmannose 4,6-dehydratase